MLTKTIALTKGLAALVDAEDVDRLLSISTCWHASNCGQRSYYAYARRSRAEGGKLVSMARAIMGEPEGMIVDHINHDTLDNRKSNLRIVSKQQNQCNVLPRTGKLHSRYKGVCYNARARLWMAYINFKGKRTYLGYFKDEIEAAKVYDCASLRLHGEHGFRNFS